MSELIFDKIAYFFLESSTLGYGFSLAKTPPNRKRNPPLCNSYVILQIYRLLIDLEINMKLLNGGLSVIDCLIQIDDYLIFLYLDKHLKTNYDRKNKIWKLLFKFSMRRFRNFQTFPKPFRKD